jgi:hypothetical protein
MENILRLLFGTGGRETSMLSIWTASFQDISMRIISGRHCSQCLYLCLAGLEAFGWSLVMLSNRLWEYHEVLLKVQSNCCALRLVRQENISRKIIYSDIDKTKSEPLLHYARAQLQRANANP